MIKKLSASHQEIKVEADAFRIKNKHLLALRKN
jgi:hypothetical protein